MAGFLRDAPRAVDVYGRAAMRDPSQPSGAVVSSANEPLQIRYEMVFNNADPVNSTTETLVSFFDPNPMVLNPSRYSIGVEGFSIDITGLGLADRQSMMSMYIVADRAPFIPDRSGASDVLPILAAYNVDADGVANPTRLTANIDRVRYLAMLDSPPLQTLTLRILWRTSYAQVKQLPMAPSKSASVSVVFTRKEWITL